MRLFALFGSADIEQLESKGDARGLIRALRHSDHQIRGQAATALVRLGGPAMGPLLRALDQKEPYVRRTAVWALGVLNDERALDPLIASLNDMDKDVRKVAAEALGHMEEPLAVKALIAALKDSDKRVRGAAVEALGKIKDARAVEPLGAALRDRSGSYVASRAAVALTQFKIPRVVEFVLCALNSKREGVREAGRRALKRLAEDATGDYPLHALVTGLRHRDPGVRKEAAKALGGLKDRRAVPALSDALRDDYLYVPWPGSTDPWDHIGAYSVREAAADALAAIGGRRAQQAAAAYRAAEQERVERLRG